MIRCLALKQEERQEEGLLNERLGGWPEENV